VSGSSNYTLTVTNGASDEARNAVLNITGTLTAAINVICPTAAKTYVVKNGTTGGFAITLKTSAGTGISVPNGATAYLYCDGTNVVSAITYLASANFDNINYTGTLAGPNINYTGTLTGGTGVVNIGSGQVYKDASGNVGIGTSSPLYALDVRSASGVMGQFLETTSGSQRRIRFSNSGAVNTIESTTGTGSTSLAIAVDGSERMRITSAGNVGIGTASPIYLLQVYGSNSGIGIQTNQANGGTGGGWIDFLTSTGTVQGNIYFNQAGGYMVFGTNTSGSTQAERMRIDSSGNILVGTATQATGAKLTVNGSIKGTITSGTAVATTSGTAIDFTGIPSWVKRITVMLNGVSTNGSSPVRLQAGSGTVQASGYSGYNLQYSNTSIAGSNVSAGFDLSVASGEGSSATRIGSVVFTLLSGNTWVANGTIGLSNTTYGSTVSGSVTLSGTLDRVRLTTQNGTDIFDAGSVNILYEG
jgi:hypothetical protein